MQFAFFAVISILIEDKKLIESVKEKKLGISKILKQSKNFKSRINYLDKNIDEFIEKSNMKKKSKNVNKIFKGSETLLQNSKQIQISQNYNKFIWKNWIGIDSLTGNINSKMLCHLSKDIKVKMIW